MSSKSDHRMKSVIFNEFKSSMSDQIKAEIDVYCANMNFEKRIEIPVVDTDLRSAQNMEMDYIQ